MTTTNTNTTTTFTLVSQWPAANAAEPTDNNEAPSAKCRCEVQTGHIHQMLNAVYHGQGNNPEGTKFDPTMCSLSVGDIVFTDPSDEDDAHGRSHGDIYAVASFGFVKITANILKAWKALDSGDRSWLIRDLDRCKTV